MAHAGKTLQQEICDEATCSICLDYFRDPVMIPECGHNFCRTCLDQYWGKLDSEASCPQCRLAVRQRSLVQNRSLASVVEIARKSTLCGQKRETDVGSICEKHQEPQKLFCQEDKSPICVVCDRSKEHRGHQVIPVEEALQEYKDQMVNCLETLKGKKEKMVVLMADKNKESQDLFDQIETEREKAVMTFRQLHQFLEEKEKRLLAQMEEVRGEVERERENHLEKLGKELQSLEGIIQEMEEKLQQPEIDLLQGIENFLERCKAETLPVTPVSFPVALKWKIWDFCDITPFLEGVTKQFQDALENGLRLQKVNVHLDPDTAHPKLIVSEDCKSVRWIETRQHVPDNLKRFCYHQFVLGCEEFTAGRHFWEVTVGSNEAWAVGVAKKTIKRKCKMGGLIACQIWEMGKWTGAYRHATGETGKVLSLSEEPRKIRVVLNYEGGRVAFYDADRGTLIYAYPGGSLPRETLLPFCYLGDNGHLTL